MNSPFIDTGDVQRQVTESESAWPVPSFNNIFIEPEEIAMERETGIFQGDDENEFTDSYYPDDDDSGVAHEYDETTEDETALPDDADSEDETWLSEWEDFSGEATDNPITDTLIDEEAYEEEDYVEPLLYNEFEVPPDAGTTIYLNVSAVENRTLKTGVFIPPGYNRGENADVVLYFHGLFPSGNKPNGIEEYWKTYANIRAAFAAGRRNAILVAPGLTSDPQQNTIVFGKPGGFDRFIEKCFSELKAGNHLLSTAQPGRIIIAGHSAGGSPIVKVLSGKHILAANIAECWGFDCCYNYGWEKLRTTIPIYHYWAYNAKGGISGPGIRGESLAKRLKHFLNIAPGSKIYHQGIIEHAWRNEINQRNWFEPLDSSYIPVISDVQRISGGLRQFADSASRIITDWAKLSPSKRTVLMIVAGNPQIGLQKALEMAWSQRVTDVNELTNLIFYLRHREMAGRKIEKDDPQSLKDEWMQIRSGIVTPFISSQNQTSPPAQSTQHTPVTAPVVTSGFKKVTLPLSGKPIILVSKNNAKKLAEISEPPSKFLVEIVAMALGKDEAVKWFDNFTRISFLGRELNNGQYVHVELAAHLKKAEKEFAALYGGPNADPAVAGDFLLGTNRENLAGSRAQSSTAKYSFHMFGLAIDVNYTLSPYIQNKERTGYSKITKKSFTKPNGKITLNTTLSHACSLFKRDNLVFDYGLGYDDYDRMNKQLVLYLTLTENLTRLQELLNSAGSGFWSGKTVNEAVKIINDDLDRLSLSVDRWSTRETFRKKGFLNISKAFVEGIGLDWGGKGYGDMMHFDMRNTGPGKKIKAAINQYIALKADEARDKFKLFNKETAYDYAMGDA